MVIIKLLSIFLAIMGTYTAWWALETSSYFWLLSSAIFYASSYGLFLRKNWAQYLYYLIAVATVTVWAYGTLLVFLTGLSYSNHGEAVISLLPGLLLCFLCCASCLIIRKSYRGTA